MRRHRSHAPVAVLAVAAVLLACQSPDEPAAPELKYSMTSESLCPGLTLGEASRAAGWGSDPATQFLDKSDKYQTNQTCKITPPAGGGRESTILVVIQISSLVPEEDVDLLREEYDSPPPGNPENARPRDITGWWDDGFSVGSDLIFGTAVVGYEAHTWVADGNAHIEVHLASPRRHSVEVEENFSALTRDLIDRARDVLPRRE